MKLVTYYDGIEPRIGIADGADLWDLRRVYASYLFETEHTVRCREFAELLVPNDMATFIRINHGRIDEFREAVNFMKDRLRGTEKVEGVVRSLHDARLLAPILAPSKVMCCGSSYAEYLEELGIERSKWPQDVKLSFLKAPSSLIGHREKVYFPPDSSQADYENELAIIIGRTCTAVSESDAAKHIFGYSILNDIGVRDVPEWAGGRHSPRGKAGDTFAPFGPCIVPASYIGNANDLRIWTTINDDIRQDSRTSHLLWPVERIVSIISRYLTLLPGDIISTGSTKGNALATGNYLKKGDVIRCHIEGIGTLENVADWRSWRTESHAE